MNDRITKEYFESDGKVRQFALVKLDKEHILQALNNLRNNNRDIFKDDEKVKVYIYHTHLNNHHSLLFKTKKEKAGILVLPPISIRGIYNYESHKHYADVILENIKKKNA